MKHLLFTILLSLVYTLPVMGQELDDITVPFLEKLNALVLPEKPTPEQSETYVKEHVRILESTKNYPLANRLARMIDLEKRLDAVPNRDIHLLFEQVDEFIMVRATFARVIEKRDAKDYKAFVIAGLADHPDNIIAIKQHGWYEDAKLPIQLKLEESSAMPPLAWWQAFTEVAEPKHYPKLKELFLSLDYFVTDYAEYLKIVPDYDFVDTTRANVFALDKKIEQIVAGQRIGCPTRQGAYRASQVALAAEGGDVEMLGRLIDELHNPEQTDRIWYYRSNRIDMWRNRVTRLIDFKGSNAEIRSWYEANRDDLVFDNFTKRFFIDEGF